MEPIRIGSGKGDLRSGNSRRRGGAPSSQSRAAVRLPPLAPEPAVVDFLDVNGELSYTTVVEGLEEFLYQKELQGGS